MSARRPQIEYSKTQDGKGYAIWAEQAFSDGIHLSDGATVETAYSKAARRLRAMANECEKKAMQLANKRKGRKS